ncbi:MAG: RagB/SusD family nutrient uptake outer membrane protein [Bacteroidales bacterium]|nr:RagB/SusD family nutrient uptake outer membrane protein [Candidatus Minthousia equi]MDO4955720.1 RagB/SusD family nutrient uptake outer membrane protein [Bacteroidales bacterium]
MKKIFIYSALSVSLCSMLTSCELEAPTKSSMNTESVFSIYELAESAVMGINQSFGETNSYRGRFLPYYGLNTDIEWINGNDGTKMPDGGKYDLCTYNSEANNSQMNTSNNAYAKFYEGIERANQAIVGMRHYSVIFDNDGNIIDPKMAQLLGELLTMRAVLYLDLIKGWGDVPARFGPITADDMYAPRTDRDEIYKQLLADLLEAEELCAWPNESEVTSTTERINKAFVKGLRARIALYAGGYSQRADGTIRLSNDPELSQAAMYAIAKKECIEVIEKFEENGNKLGSFKENFYRLSTDEIGAGKESLWEIPFSETRGRVMYTFGIKHQSKDQYTQQNQGGVNGPTPILWYDYDIDDVRRDITCAPYRWSNNANAVQEPWAWHSWCFGKLRYEWTADKRIVTNTNDDGINWQYMRMGDVYLMAAEAVNEIDNPTEAWKYMNPIVERALPKAKVEYLKTKYTASKSAFFEGVVEQRAFELAGEMLRKADLIRWNLLKTKLDEAKAKMLQLLKHEGKYSDLPTKIYYTYEADGETLKIYGLNYGDTDAEGALLESNEGYSSMNWLKKKDDGTDEKRIDALYLTSKNPDQNQYWPIWTEFINASNGSLDNKWLNQ